GPWANACSSWSPSVVDDPGHEARRVALAGDGALQPAFGVRPLNSRRNVRECQAAAVLRAVVRAPQGARLADVEAGVVAAVTVHVGLYAGDRAPRTRCRAHRLAIRVRGP